MSDGARNVLFFVLSIAVLGWFLTRVQETNREDPQQPGLLSQFLAERAIPLEPPQQVAGGANSYYDPQVRPATGTAPAVLTAQVAVGDSHDTSVVIEQGTSPVFEWHAVGTDPILLVDNSQITVRVTGKANTEFVVTGDGVIPQTDPLSPTDWKANIVGERELTIKIGDKTKTVTVRAPNERPELLAKPVIRGAANNLYKEVVAPQRIRLHLAETPSDKTYLKMAGSDVKPDDLRFAFFLTDGGKAKYQGRVNPRRMPAPRDLDWQAEAFRLPAPLAAGNNGIVCALALSQSGHRYSDALAFTIAAANKTLQIENLAVKSAAKADDDTYLVTDRNFTISGQIQEDSTGASDIRELLEDSYVIAYLNNPQRPVGRVAASAAWELSVELNASQTHNLKVATMLGSGFVGPIQTLKVLVEDAPPKIEYAEALDDRLSRIKITFNQAIKRTPNFKDAFLLRNEETNELTKPIAGEFERDNVTILSFNVVPGTYRLEVVPSSIQNLVDAVMVDEFEKRFYRQLQDLISPSRGIPGPQAPNVEFAEYTPPRDFIDGFNPSDRVETRVSRLYYFRDAHRVAQIVNRDAKSYNRAAVLMQEQIANKARQTADQATDERRSRERQAVRQAQETRAAERRLEQAQEEVNRKRADADRFLRDQARFEREAAEAEGDDVTRLENQANIARQSQQSAIAAAENAQQRVEEAFDRVEELREQEAQANEEWQQALTKEDRTREEQFRREVAAAHEDPDTYAPGNPCSNDPVQQVSVSVIGEGLIQLRGPIKGINIIRTMINQLDAPVGQVRVAIHTVQINGERGDRMERVATRIQRYIDHSRFLTLQSAEMLRKAIVKVAAQQAMQFYGGPGMSQEERDQKYLHAFFGEDFIRELAALDSEFLKTGNKLLAIHSMDSTSLASALFLMALAKNSTRLQILQEFENMMSCELPAAEQQYFDAGYTCKCKRMRIGRACEKCERKRFPFLSENARFQSLRGMFNAELQDDSTMTPMQREFVRLAQIFKSRLIVELELKQRVMERAVIEERLGDRQHELKLARELERKANEAVGKAQRAVAEQQQNVLTAVAEIAGILKWIADDLEAMEAAALQLGFQRNRSRSGIQLPEQGRITVDGDSVTWTTRLMPDGEEILWFGQDTHVAVWNQAYETYLNRAKSVTRQLDQLAFADEDRTRLDSAKGILNGIERDIEREKSTRVTRSRNRETVQELGEVYTILLDLKGVVEEHVQPLRREANSLVADLGEADADFNALYSRWVAFRERADTEIKAFNDLDRRDRIKDSLRTADNGFRTILEKSLDLERTLERAREARRPLDHKKFLDMLVDEMEDKYIELLEGTRAHTANIDAYIKRVITSLDDDFNTQFYYPTFRYVREASRSWDVQLGQVETTNVLANNRSFGKVTPEATMEFDLPKRDILIVEAMNGAKAAIDDFGALAQDPTFLSLAKLGSGQPTSSPAPGSTLGQPVVNYPLPSLSTENEQDILAQHGPGNTQFGAALENLIPDPAIYKFETGTGWEIRPVIQPDGQALVFHFNYMYTTNIREPVRADEKHLGRVKRHFVDTDVQLSNFELREISRYTVGLKAARTSRGVPLLEDIPGVGLLFRPLPSDESSLQQNIILGQATIFPTLFDLMGLRWAPAVADLDPLRLSSQEFTVRNRRRVLMNRVFDKSSSEVDKFLRIPEAERRMDLYRSQETVPSIHPNGYEGPGANLIDSQLQEGYSPLERRQTEFVPSGSKEGSRYVPSQIEGGLQLNPPGSRGTYRSSGSESRSLSMPAPENEQPPVRYSEPAPAYQQGQPQPHQDQNFFNRSMQSQPRLQRLPATTPVLAASTRINRLPAGSAPGHEGRRPQPQYPVQQASFVEQPTRLRSASQTAPLHAAPAQSTRWTRMPVYAPPN